jgi:hypothetical protein
VIRQGLTLSLLLAVGACAGSPAASPQEDALAKRFDRPDPERGALYVYRSGLFGVARPLDVAIVNGVQGKLGYNTYMRIEGPPGPVEVACKAGDKTASQQVDIGPGQTHYVRTSMTVGLLGPNCEVAEVPPDEGQAAVRSAKRVEPQQ